MDSKKSIKIKLTEVWNVNEFVQLASRCGIDADVHTVANHRHVVPADSLMGMFSLDLTKALYVNIVSDDDEMIDRFILGCKDWIVE